MVLNTFVLVIQEIQVIHQLLEQAMNLGVHIYFHNKVQLVLQVQLVRLVRQAQLVTLVRQVQLVKQD